MEIHAVPITKKKLLAMPENERLLFLRLGQFANDIAILSKLSLYLNRRGASEPETRTQMGMFMMVSRLLAAKLYEGWDVLTSGFFNGLSRDIKLDAKEEEAASWVRKYFGRKNLLHHIRNSEFHYDEDRTRKALDSCHEDLLSYIYVQEAVGNSYFAVAEDVRISGVKHATGATDEVDAVERLHNELILLLNNLHTITGGVLFAIAQRHFGSSFEDQQAEPMTVEAVHFQEAVVPFFIRKE